MSVLRANRIPLSGMAAGLSAFLIGVVLFNSPLIALLIGAGVGVGVGLIVLGVFPFDPDLAEYRLDAQRRVRKLNKLLDNIEQLAKKVANDDARVRVTRGCKVLRDIIKMTQEKDPSSVASTAASLSGYTSSVNGVLSTYLVLQDDPEIPGSKKAMQEALEGFTAFQKTAEEKKAQALKGDLLLMRADLQTLKPLPQLTLSEGE